MRSNSMSVVMGLFVAVVFSLVGCGGGGGSDSTQPVANTAPVANAGTAQSVVIGNPVTVDGSNSSDANNDLMTYLWTFASKPANSTANPSSATVVKPTFIPDVSGAYVLNLVVNDGKMNSVAATVTVTASIGVPTILASWQNLPSDIAVDSTSVYWIDSGTVKKVSIDGGTEMILAAGTGAQLIALDSNSVYFGSQNAIMKMAKSGGAITTLASGLINAFDIAVDSNSVYWC